jgi:tetrahydromethanopterin S-methyltransferase subunit F
VARGTTRPRRRWGRFRRAGVVLAALVAVLVGVSACSTIDRVTNAVHDIRGNTATIDAFNTKLQSGTAATFEATYVTTGIAPATIVYAVEPPTGVAFDDTPTGGSGDTTPVHIVVNATGEFVCAQSGTQWNCQKSGTADAATENKIFDVYTPAHWVSFLREFSLAAALAGDKVATSTMTVNGFPMSCVDFMAAGVAGTSTICTTTHDILGYVKVASDSVSFEIQKFTTSPSSSLFQLPPGAKVTATTAPASSP